MHWSAPSEKDTDNATLEKRLLDAADQFRANSGLKSQARNGSMSSKHSGKGDIRNGSIEAEKMDSNSWKVHHNIQS